MRFEKKKTSEITQEEIETILRMEMLTSGQAAYLVQYRLNVSSTLYYKLYRPLIPFQSVGFSSENKVMRVRKNVLEKLITYWQENARFITRINESDTTENPYMEDYVAYRKKIAGF
ncbi:MAG: hypothetical protein LAT67_05030 [Balneolales bacterium]|nr:hypothetical protein [Balneolales bacterium]